jgi:chromosome segregation ATPase
LFATLTSSDFALSSEEARQVLSKLDPKELQASEPSMLDRAMNKKSIAEEIDSLADLEASFTDKLILYEETDSQWNNLLSQRDSAKMTVSTSKIAEIEARKSLERAQRMVAEAKEHLVTTSKALRAVEQQVRKNALEMDTVTTQLTRNQERVRTALKKKTEMGMGTPNLTEADLAVLRQKEVKLLGESAQIELMVARLSSRAEKLKMRGIALERWEQNGRPDLNGANNGSTTASSQTTEEDQLKSYL